jgi:hypothetical protein
VRLLLAALVAAAAVTAAWPAAGGATDECKGIRECIPVAGPWVVVAHGAPSEYLLFCPAGRGVVGGLDAAATSTAVRIEFSGRLGAPVSPGVTTTRSAFFRGVIAGAPRRAAFQPHIGCIPTGGGGGRSTVSARAVVRPGAPLERYAKNVPVRPGSVTFGAVTCARGNKRTGAWDVLAFRTKKPPDLAQASLVDVTRVISEGRVVVTVAASDQLSPDVRAVVQVGVECAL